MQLRPGLTRRLHFQRCSRPIALRKDVFWRRICIRIVIETISNNPNPRLLPCIRRERKFQSGADKKESPKPLNWAKEHGSISVDRRRATRSPLISFGRLHLHLQGLSIRVRRLDLMVRDHWKVLAAWSKINWQLFFTVLDKPMRK